MRASRYSRSQLTLLLLCSLVTVRFSKAEDPHSKNALYTKVKDYFQAPTVNAYTRDSPFTLPRDVWRDQKAMAASSMHFTKADLRWLLPLAATTGILIGTDHHVATLIHTNSVNRNRSALVSNAGLATFAGAAATAYGIGVVTHNEHARETGRLSAEAITDAFLAVEALKIVTARQRPDTASAHGLFEQASPFNSSFPSQHAAIAWSAATVFAHEYPGPVTQWSAYGLASLVSLSRITAEKHFPSDVLIGAAAGYLIGRFVYRAHHNDRMTDRTGSTPAPAYRRKDKQSFDLITNRHRSESAKGSPYVPLDSWVYPALKRLAALGYLPDQASNLAPWTRAECFRQTEEAADLAGTREFRTKRQGSGREALRLIADLKREFGHDDLGDNIIRLESLYTRLTEISGTPLRDSYHFGQTVVNDGGRPYEKGVSNVSGFSTYMMSGPFFAYFRGEYQYAPGREPSPLSVRQFIASADGNPVQGAIGIPTTNRFQTQEMYAGVRLGFENITFGKQSLWWGPGEGSAFSFSNNAEPFYLLRFSQAQPLVLPGIFSRLGKIRTEFVFGKLSGHQWPPRPYVNAQKVTLDLTDNFELGFTRSSFFGGVGHPLTFGNLAASLISTKSSGASGYGARNDPGDRHGGFDFRYRIPGLRRYVTVYSDSFADDDPSPIDNPKRSAWAPGLYLSQIPGLRKLDFRFETYSTWLYRKDEGGNFLYYNTDYHDSYTNKGQLLGSWIGRDSRAYTASTTYWLSARSKVQAQYNQIKAGGKFLPGGGTQTQASLASQWSLTPEWIVSARAQFERYNIPVLGGPRKDMLCTIQVLFTPHNWGH